MKHKISPLNALQRSCLLLSLLAVLQLNGCSGGKQPVTPYGNGTAGNGSETADRASLSGASSFATQDHTAYTRDELMPALVRINDRIASYEQKQQAWTTLNRRMAGINMAPDQAERFAGCSQQVEGLLTDYKRLHRQLLHEKSMELSRQLVIGTLPELEKEDFAYLEGGCPQRLSGSIAETQSIEAVIETGLADGNYEQVITAYQSLPLVGSGRPEAKLQYGYGTALMKSGRQQEARTVFLDLLARVRRQGSGRWETNLLQVLADLDFALGNYAVARNRYKDLDALYNSLGKQAQWAGIQQATLDSVHLRSTETRDYAALLLGVLAYNPQRDGFTVFQQIQAFQQRYPESVAAENVAELARSAGADAEKWFAGLLEQADQLSREQRNSEALFLLEQVPENILPLDKQAIINLKKRGLSVAAARVRFPPPDSLQQDVVIEEEVLETSGVEKISNEVISGEVQAPPYTVEPETPVDESPVSSELDVETFETVTPDQHVALSALEETWNQGVANMQAREYDKAIAVFSGLLNTSHGSEARARIEEASRLAAQEDRKKAAELFVRANRTENTTERKQLLLSSRALLERILQEYPQSGLEDKVKRNLRRINQELADIEQTIAPTQLDETGGETDPAG